MSHRIALFLLIWAALLTTEHAVAQPLQRAIAQQYDDPALAISIADSLLIPSTEDTLRSKALEVIGIAEMVRGNLSASYDAHAKALAIRRKLKWDAGIGHSYNNMGLALYRMRNFEGAMKCFLTGLETAEQLQSTTLLTRIYGNIGTLYEEQQDYDRALEFYAKTMDLLEAGKDERVLTNTLHNIALVYARKKEFDKSINFWKRTMNLRVQMQDERGLAYAQSNMGSLVYVAMGNFGAADSLYALALDAYEQADDSTNMSMVLGNMGQSALRTGRTADAIRLCERSYQIAKNVVMPEYEESACQCLADALDRTGDHEAAIGYLKRYLTLKDSMRVSDSGRQAALLEQRYRHEQEQLRERMLAEEEIKRQHLLRNMSVALGMMGILLFFAQYRSYRKKLLANEQLESKNVEILAQKEQIAEKSKEITDSIQYAKRLQEARLPRSSAYDTHFAQCHVLYLPKDIVSGDFHWLEEVNGHLFLAVADCTGHGVPGAMVSMVGIQGLNQAVLERGMTSPAAILQHLSDHVEEAFHKSGTSVRDGMDISLCVIAPDRKHLTYAGANNPLWQLSTVEAMEGAQLRESRGDLHLHEWKADRRSIGGYFDAGSFTEKQVEIHQGDAFVMMSDGYADQFGGNRDRKLGSPRMRKLALEAVQKNDLRLLDNAFQEWKGAQDQIDDVAVVCFTV